MATSSYSLIKKSLPFLLLSKNVNSYTQPDQFVGSNPFASSPSSTNQAQSQSTLTSSSQEQTEQPNLPSALLQQFPVSATVIIEDEDGNHIGTSDSEGYLASSPEEIEATNSLFGLTNGGLRNANTQNQQPDTIENLWDQGWIEMGTGSEATSDSGSYQDDILLTMEQSLKLRQQNIHVSPAKGEILSQRSAGSNGQMQNYWTEYVNEEGDYVVPFYVDEFFKRNSSHVRLIRDALEDLGGNNKVAMRLFFFSFFAKQAPF